MRKLIDINTPGGNVCGYQYSDAFLLKVLQCLLPCILGFVTVDGLGLDTYTHQVLAQLVGTMFCLGKNKGIFY